MSRKQLKKVKKIYPKAEPINWAFDNIMNEASKLGLAPHKITYADSFCCDEVDTTQLPQKGMNGPFKLGGLGGYPFSGITGMNAFAAHIPEDNGALIIYGPHIGITKTGSAGKITRIGQARETNCCGSLSAALEHLLSNEIPDEQSPSEADYQQEMIEQLLLNKKERILQADEKIIETIEAFYEIIDRKIDKLISETTFNCRSILQAGGIFINSDKISSAYWAPRRFNILNP